MLENLLKKYVKDSKNFIFLLNMACKKKYKLNNNNINNKQKTKK